MCVIKLVNRCWKLVRIDLGQLQVNGSTIETFSCQKLLIGKISRSYSHLEPIISYVTLKEEEGSGAGSGAGAGGYGQYQTILCHEILKCSVTLNEKDP